MFLLSDVINCKQSSFGYLLLTKRKFWGEIYTKVNTINLSQLEAVIAKIEKTGKYTNLDILTLKQQIQILVSKSPQFFTKYANQPSYIKALILNDGMPVLWITINLFDFRRSLVLILAGMLYELNDANTSLKAIARMIATMNNIAMAYFSETIYRGIFEHLLAAGSKNRRLFNLISTYFSTVETNSKGMLYLLYLVCLCDAFYITKLHKQL